MDSIFIWMVAGATISLLGVFLIASERELKSKRLELEELKDKLAEGPVQEISNTSTDVFPQENGTSAELVARNEALLQQVSSLSKKLEASESKLEQLETLRAHLNGKESENTELRADHERLQAELSTLRNLTESNDPRSDEARLELGEETKSPHLRNNLKPAKPSFTTWRALREQLADAESAPESILRNCKEATKSVPFNYRTLLPPNRKNKKHWK